MRLSSKIKVASVNGFTLIELMVSIAIFAIMSTILMTNYPDSLVRTNLFNLTSKVVLLLREAQVRGSTVDSQRNASGVDTVIGYGVFIDKANQEIVSFADSGSVDSIMGDKIYKPSSESATSLRTKLANGYVIDNLYTYSNNVKNSDVLSSLTISFVRPSVKANIMPGNVVPATSPDSACIELKATKNGAIRSIQVYSFGRIISSTQLCPQ